MRIVNVALLALGLEGARRAAHERADLAVILVERDSSNVDTIWLEAELEGRLAASECAQPVRVARY